MTVKVTINGKEVEVEKGKTILDACKIAGIEVPTLCHHESLTPTGACRICVVEVEGARTLVPACSFVVTDGMKIFTDTQRVIAARKMVLELLLSAHPLDCLTCEKSGDCKLQDYAYKYGVKGDRFHGEKYNYPIDDTNPFFIRDYNKCILCGRCVRVCEEVQGQSAIEFIYRGFSAKIGTPFDGPLQDSTCVFCGQCVNICPVGALVEKSRIGKGREWEFKKVKTVCSYCGVGCNLILHVKDGKIAKVTGDWESPVNKGRTCVKGKFGFDYVESEDRLKKPLIKEGGEFKETSWENALSIVEKRLKEIKEKYGPDSIGVLSSAKVTNEENYLAQKFARAAIGTNNVDHCARLCHASTVAGLAAAFGSGAMTNSIDDIKEADCILVIGSNTTETHPVIALEVKEAVRKLGKKLIVCDPRRIELVDLADIWINQRPGTDVALINGMMNVIISENLYDKEFVETRTEGFLELKDCVSKYTPEYVEKITEVPKEKIIEAARMYASSKSTILYAMGITQHTTGTANVKSLANLAMLTGNIGKPGTGVNPLRGQNNVQGACDLGALPNVFPGYQRVTEDSIREKFEKAWGVKLPKEVGLTVVEMMDALLDGRLKALYIVGENPAMSDPDLNHVREALKKAEFLVVQDIFMSETANYAHVVLPGVSFAEKDGTFTNTERRVQRVRKAIEPLGDSKPDWEILTELLNRFGIRSSYTHPSEIMDEIALLTPIYGGISYDRIEDVGLQWPCPSPDHPGTKILHVGKFTRGLGKFHPCEHIDPAELPDKEYPLILMTGRVLYHYHTIISRKSASIDEYYPNALLEVSLADAKELGIEDGEVVRVSTRRGSVEVKAHITDRVKKGRIFLAFHFNEAPANMLTIAALDPEAKIPEFKVCAAKLEKI